MFNTSRIKKKVYYSKFPFFFLDNSKKKKKKGYIKDREKEHAITESFNEAAEKCPESLAIEKEQNDNSSSVEHRDYDAEIVQDTFSLSNGSYVDKDQMFCKNWKVRNTGELEWPKGTVLKYFGRKGNPLIVQEEYSIVTPVKPGQCVDVSVFVRVPSAPGRYLCEWRLVTPDGRNFGQELTCATTIAGEYSN
ncbi:hypothetical protein RFI_23592 [Reticulomyxa filosa]|uniref:Nbr1 FW domain-containing protein n=1 Tax=Reticulomyxa filosa TaxID=46433 RepID=X6MJD9_RETFI|nr:hypothetical protein RFI_23592 [Reticulomyxa filosa]|eukprot:ETO13776.1 hypothetical protein RFI_23592 [Reticulomyxa filosa]